MKELLKRLVRSLLARTPYRIDKRGQANRFQAIEDAIADCRLRGFRPQVIVDGGANTGEFTRSMLTLFPQAKLHAIEPQEGCASSLAALAQSAAEAVRVHHVALCAPEAEGGTLVLATDAQATSTGAHVVEGQSDDDRLIVVPCLTLDSLVASQLNPGDRVFLKLDLQGFEMEALRGAQKLLAATDLVLTEVSFFAQAYEPPIAELVAFLDEAGFELYDIGSIGARRRDNRARQGDFFFARKGGVLTSDTAWA